MLSELEKLENNKEKLNEFLSNSTEIIKSILDELDFISSQSEIQFSKISESLQTYYAETKEISGETSVVLSEITGKKYNGYSESLKSIFNNIINSIGKTQKKFESSEEFFDEIIDSFDVIGEDVLEFKRLVKYLRIQEISTKIESSRLGNDDRGFKNLAENVDNQSKVISDKSNKFRAETKLLISLIKNVRTEDINLKKEQQKYLNTILNDSEASLDLLFNKNKESLSKYEIINSNFREIRKNIGTAVTSVQFHDITRQQIQHVYSTLENLIKKIESVIISDMPGQEQLIDIAYSISKVQYEQLKHTREELYLATDSIIDNLTGISANIQNMITEITKLLETGNNENHTFIEDIKNGLINITAILKNNGHLGKSFSDSINKVITSIESLAEFINEIGEIGSEIELISLNSNIKAVNIGNEGSALAVIAREIQKLSIDARKQTDELIQKIVKVNNFTRNFRDTINKEDGIKESEQIIKDFNNILNSLSTIIEGAATKTALIQSSAEKLQLDLNQTIKEITIHIEAEAKINLILNKLNEIMEESKMLGGERIQNNTELDEISMNYTMQSQRIIHNNVTSLLNDKEPEITGSINDNSGFNSNEFGDNVELF